jgi:hypothetical protein
LGLGEKYMREVRLYQAPVVKTKAGPVTRKPSLALRAVFAGVLAIESGWACKRTKPPTIPPEAYLPRWPSSRRRAAVDIVNFFALCHDATRTFLPAMYTDAGERIMFSRAVMCCGAPWNRDVRAKADVWARLVKTGFIVKSPGPGKNKGRDRRASFYAFKAFETTRRKK